MDCPDNAREDIVMIYIKSLKVGDCVKDIEYPKLGFGIVAGYLSNGHPLIFWGNIMQPCAAGLGTRPLD